MEIRIKKEGGFAGVHEQLGPVDTVQLDDGGQVVRRIEEIDFFEMPAKLPMVKEISDGFTYRTKVNDGGRSHEVVYFDGSEQNLRKPLDELEQLLIELGGKFVETPLEARSSTDFDWEAWYNKMPGRDDPALHVAGSCELPSSNIELSLEPGNIGSVPEPSVFALKLKITWPDFGDDVMTRKEVAWSADVGPGIELVRIQGDAQAEIIVKDVR